MTPATRAGLRYGLLLGGLAVFNHTLETVADLGPTLSAVRGVSMWAVTFLFFGMASRQVSDRVATIPLGMAASGLSAVVSTGLLIVYAIALAALRSQPLTAATVASTGLTHLAGSVAIALFVATVGGCIASTLPPTGRIPVQVAAGCAIVLLGAALGSIIHASSLERSLRPPFIAFGLPGLAIALAAVAPIMSAAVYGRPGNTGSASPADNRKVPGSRSGERLPRARE